MERAVLEALRKHQVAVVAALVKVDVLGDIQPMPSVSSHAPSTHSEAGAMAVSSHLQAYSDDHASQRQQLNQNRTAVCKIARVLR